MRVVSLNGAAFIFLQRGEKLKENEGLRHNKFPDRKLSCRIKNDSAMPFSERAVMKLKGNRMLVYYKQTISTKIFIYMRLKILSVSFLE